MLWSSTYTSWNLRRPSLKRKPLNNISKYDIWLLGISLVTENLRSPGEKMSDSKRKHNEREFTFPLLTEKRFHSAGLPTSPSPHPMLEVKTGNIKELPRLGQPHCPPVPSTNTASAQTHSQIHVKDNHEDRTSVRKPQLRHCSLPTKCWPQIQTN